MLALSSPGLAGASSHAAAVHSASVPAASSVTLPLFGAQLTVDITTGPGGALTSVAVNPAGGLTATKVKPNTVVFKNADGTGSIVVKNRHGRQSVAARAGSLADISGPGHWSGDVFGTGTPTTVDFTVGAAADGSPDITAITSSDAAALIGTVQHRAHGDHQAAGVRITFANAAQQRSLVIGVKVDTPATTTDPAGTKTKHDDHADAPRATLSMSLGSVRGVPQAAADAAGSHTWDGTLCDGSAAHIDYVVAADGVVSGVVATPGTPEVKVGKHGVQVRFADHQSVQIRVRAKDGKLTINVNENIRCKGAPAPVVNTPVSTVSDAGLAGGAPMGGHHGAHKRPNMGGSSSATTSGWSSNHSNG
jgi:hypothetical protein